MSCPKKWINQKRPLWDNIQLKSESHSIPKEKRLTVPEEDEEKDFIYLINNWK